MRAYLAQPEWLWLLAAVPLLVWRASAGRSRRSRDWSALGRPGGSDPPGDGSAGWVAAAVCLVVALAEPRWGRSGHPPLPAGHDLVIALDVSRSMAAEDVVPHRLGRAVEAAGSLVSSLGAKRGDRAAVVAFSGRGVTRCPLTENLGAVSETLNSLRTGTVRPGGTDLAAALDAALDAFDDQDRAEGRAVVLISDGEDHPGHWAAAVERVRERGVVVHTVSIGDAEHGHPVPVAVPPRQGPEGTTPARVEPLRYRGEVVLSKRSDEALGAIARATGGAFVPLGLATTDLGRLYRTRIEPTAKARRDVTLAPEPAERFGLFVLAALGVGLNASRPRRRRPSDARTWLATAAAVALAVLAFAVLGAGPIADAPTRRQAAVPDAPALTASGRAAYAAGRFEDALTDFRLAGALEPENPVPHYNAAAALYQMGRHAEALAAYGDARALAGAALRTKVDYALGNTALALGDLTGSIRHYESCLASTARGPELDEVRRRAAANKKFVEEQARHAPQPPQEGDGPKPAPQPGGDRPGDDRDGREGPHRGSGDGSDRPGAGRDGGTGRPPTGRGAVDGSGGGGPNSSPPGAGGDSPERRLEEALDHIRDSRRSRVDDDTTFPAEDHSGLKDW